MNVNKVIPGPADLVISGTTVGHTLEGGTLTLTRDYLRFTTHESGNTPVAVKQHGGAQAELKVTLLEITSDSLALFFPDATATTTGIEIRGGDLAGSDLPTFSDVRLQGKNVGGDSVAAVLKTAVALAPETRFVGQASEDGKWQVDVTFVGRWVDSGTIAVVSGV